MKIFAAACAGGPDAWDHQLVALRRLYKQASSPIHTWVDSPEEADVIFLTNADQPHGNALVAHPLPRRFPEKCFHLSEQWQPPFLLAGIYANAPRTAFWRGRFRTGSYALHHPDFKNPFIENYTPDQTLPACERCWLFTFAGRDCHPVRRTLFDLETNASDIRILDTSSFDAFSHDPFGKEDAHRRYFDECLRSKFILCPRGAGPNSIRLFEALKLGIAPIIISDAWIPCEGPDWSSFAFFIAEKDIASLEPRVRAIEPEFEARGRLARQAYEAFFAPDRYFNYLVEAAASIRRARIVPERIFITLRPVASFLRRAHRHIRPRSTGP